MGIITLEQGSRPSPDPIGCTMPLNRQTMNSSRPYPGAWMPATRPAISKSQCQKWSQCIQSLRSFMPETHLEQAKALRVAQLVDPVGELGQDRVLVEKISGKYRHMQRIKSSTAEDVSRSWSDDIIYLQESRRQYDVCFRQKPHHGPTFIFVVGSLLVILLKLKSKDLIDDVHLCDEGIFQ